MKKELEEIEKELNKDIEKLKIKKDYFETQNKNQFEIQQENFKNQQKILDEHKVIQSLITQKRFLQKNILELKENIKMIETFQQENGKKENTFFEKTLTIQEVWIDTGLAVWNENKDGVYFKKNVTYVPSVNDGYLLKTCCRMFSGCKKLIEVELFDTSNVTNMHRMFNGCISIKNIPVFDVINVVDMSYMFHYCEKLIKVYFFNTNNVIDMRYMFSHCYSLKQKSSFILNKHVEIDGMYIDCAFQKTINEKGEMIIL